MAYAPHQNDHVHNQRLMGLPHVLPVIQGQFTMPIGGVYEYAERRHPDPSFAPDFQQMIYVGPKYETRLARVLKTVAYIIVDENPDGTLMVEKWKLSGQRSYDVAGIGEKGRRSK